MNDTTVLVVDDDALARRSIISILDEGTRASVAGECVNGAEAVRFLAQHRVDIVLMDLHMPVMGGVEAIKTIHDTHPGVSVVALTSLGVRDDVLECDNLKWPHLGAWCWPELAPLPTDLP